MLFMMCSFCKTLFSPLCACLTLMVHLLFFAAAFMVYLPDKWVDVFFDLYCMFSLRSYYKKKGISPNLQSVSTVQQKQMISRECEC